MAIKKTKQRSGQTSSLFPEIETTSANTDLMIREDKNIAQYPIGLLSRKPLLDDNGNPIYTYTVKLDDNHSWTMIGNKEMGGLPLAHHIDYFFALLSLAFEKTGFLTNTVYFTVHELVLRAGKIPGGDEYQRALEAITIYRGFIIRTKVYKVIGEGGDIKYLKEDVSYLQHFTIVGDMKKGRKSSSKESLEGLCKVVFSDFFIENLRSQQLSTLLNFSFMMRLSTPIAKQLYKLIDFWRSESSPDSTGKSCLIRKELIEIAKLLPLSATTPSKIRQLLEGAHKELLNLKYLEKVVYIKQNGNIHSVEYEVSPFTSDESYILSDLIKRGVSSGIARELIRTQGSVKISDAIRYYDIKKKKKPLKPGYLVEIIRNASAESLKEGIHEAICKHEKRESLKGADISQWMMIYDQEMDKIVSQIKVKMSEGELAALESEARKSAFYTANEEIYRHSIENTISEIIKARAGLPKFEEWVKKQGKNNLRQ